MKTHLISALLIAAGMFLLFFNLVVLWATGSNLAIDVLFWTRMVVGNVALATGLFTSNWLVHVK